MPTTADQPDDVGTQPTIGGRTIAVLVLLALVLRLGVLQRDAERLETDPDSYVRLAKSLAIGDGYSTAESQTPTAFRPVVYPMLLAGSMKLGLRPPIAVAFLNLLAAAVLVIATVLLAQAVWRDHTVRRGRNVSLAAGLFVAADPLLLRYSTEPMTECVSAALMAVSLLACVRYIQSPPTWRRAIVCGCLLGLSALCRPVAYVTCVAVTIAFLLRTMRSPMPRRRAVVFSVLPAIAAALTVSPWIIRNAVHFGRLIPATTHGGYTLLLANNPVFYEKVVSGQQDVWDGKSLTKWQRTLQAEQQRDGIVPGDEVSSDRWMYARAMSAIRNQPSMFVRGCVLRWKRFWALRPSAESESLPAFVNTAVAAWYVMIGIGLIGGAAICFRKSGSRTPTVLLWVAVASFLVIHTFYWTNTRMRAPLTGPLAVLSSVGWSFWFAVLGWRRGTST